MWYIIPRLTMSDHVESERREVADSEQRTGNEDSVAVEMYETDGNVVLFDAQNPLAWLEAGSTVPLREFA
jgi:hypothetical protein